MGECSSMDPEENREAAEVRKAIHSNNKSSGARLGVGEERSEKPTASALGTTVPTWRCGAHCSITMPIYVRIQSTAHRPTWRLSASIREELTLASWRPLKRPS
ncbi:hypothetical protein Scep_011951 [Stephania cephalantha]|uniref:Uncharacterized protein n=1 Tax=Stephania cephalantha TaxID=152367 RepID=A0AAP0JG31_9MAGN